MFRNLVVATTLASNVQKRQFLKQNTFNVEYVTKSRRHVLYQPLLIRSIGICISPVLTSNMGKHSCQEKVTDV